MYNNHIINSDSLKDFWDSLQQEILISDKKITNSDIQCILERDTMFSIFFRGTPNFEVMIYQALLGIKDYGYLILLELRAPDHISLHGDTIDEFELHHFIKDRLSDYTTTIGPWINNRISILIGLDTLRTDEEFIQDSISMCRSLSNALEEHFRVSIHMGIGTVKSITSIYTSFIQALNSLSFRGSDNIVHYRDIKQSEDSVHFDYRETLKYLLEAVRLRKAEAYDYFGLIMEQFRSLPDEEKRNKIIELMVLTIHTTQQDNTNDLLNVDYISSLNHFMELSGEQLIEFAYQKFIYHTSFVKQQNSIDYSNHIVQVTKEYLENHYAEDISLEDVAEQVNISPQYFSKLIKKTTGFNFIDWLSMLRVKKAKELLTNSNLTVKEVCFMVGYKDPNYFSRIFKKRIGITPSDYIKKQLLF